MTSFFVFVFCLIGIAAIAVFTLIGIVTVFNGDFARNAWKY